MSTLIEPGVYEVKIDSNRTVRFWLAADGIHFKRTDARACKRLGELEGVLSFQNAVAAHEKQLSLPGV